MIYASDKLSIDSSGSSRFTVFGEPKVVEENIQGSGWITKGDKI